MYIQASGLFIFGLEGLKKRPTQNKVKGSKLSPGEAWVLVCVPPQFCRGVSHTKALFR